MKMQLTTPTDLEVVISRAVRAPRRIVWETWTRPEHVSRWLLGPEGWTMPVCEIDLRPGGKWRFVWRKSDGREMEMTGAYREVSPPERLVHTERWGPEWPETITTLTLAEKGGETTITQSILYPSREARDAAVATGMASGVDVSIDRLDRLLETLA